MNHQEKINWAVYWVAMILLVYVFFRGCLDADAGSFTVIIDHDFPASVDGYRLYFDPEPDGGGDYVYKHVIDLKGNSAYTIHIPGYAGWFYAVATVYNKYGESAPSFMEVDFKLSCGDEDIDGDGDVDGVDLSLAEGVIHDFGTVCKPISEMPSLRVTVSGKEEKDIWENPPFSPILLRINIE